MQRFIRVTMSVLPFLLIGGLVYSAIFIKPEIAANTVHPPAIERGDFLYGVALPAPDALWAAGSNGKVWRSSDSGKAWTVQSTPTHENLQDIAAWDASHAVAVGNDGGVIRTVDGGKTWTSVEVPKSKIANKLVRVRIFGDGRAWAVGEAGTALYSDDRGVTWKRGAPEEDLAWNDVFVDGQKTWLIGEFGSIRSSIDGGEHWTPANSPVKTSLMAVAFRDSENGVAVGLDGVILTTRDGGHAWAENAKVTREHLFDLLWDGKKWAAVGDKGVVVTADAPAAEWKVALLAPDQRAWHTKIIRAGNRYMATGATFVATAADRAK
jgi:photosystem II stability/assembly factor-like uncharacterized protein